MTDIPHTHEGSIARLNWSMVAVVFAIMVQTAGMVWWASGVTQRVGSLERDTAPLRDGTLARLDERTSTMKLTMDRRFEHQSNQLDAIRTLLLEGRK